MNEIMAYEANDGTVFREKHNAETYEKMLEAVRIIKNIMPKSFNEKIENADRLLAAIVVNYKKELKEIIETIR